MYCFLIKVLLLRCLLWVQFQYFLCICLCSYLVQVLVRWLVSVLIMMLLQLLFLVLYVLVIFLVLILVVVMKLLMQLCMLFFFGVMKLVSDRFGLLFGLIVCCCRWCRVVRVLLLVLQIFRLLCLIWLVGQKLNIVWVLISFLLISFFSIVWVLLNNEVVVLLIILLVRMCGYLLVRFQEMKNGVQLMYLVSIVRLILLSILMLVKEGVGVWQLVQLNVGLLVIVCLQFSCLVWVLWLVVCLWIIVQLVWVWVMQLVFSFLDSRLVVMFIVCEVLVMQIIVLLLYCGLIFIVVCVFEVVVLLIISGNWKFCCCIFLVMWIILFSDGVIRLDRLMMLYFLVMVVCRIFFVGIIMLRLIMLQLLQLSIMLMMFLLMLCMLFFIVVIRILFLVFGLLFFFVSMKGIRWVIVCFIICVDLIICGRNILLVLNRLLIMFILDISGFLMISMGCVYCWWYFLVFLMIQVVMFLISVCLRCFLMLQLCYFLFLVFLIVLLFLQLLVIVSRVLVVLGVWLSIMFLIWLCSVFGILLQIFSWLVLMMFMVRLLWIVQQRNIEWIVLCIGLLLWNEKDMLDILFELRVQGRLLWMQVQVLMKLIVQLLCFSMLVVMVKMFVLKMMFFGGKLILLIRMLQECLQIFFLCVWVLVWLFLLKVIIIIVVLQCLYRWVWCLKVLMFFFIEIELMMFLFWMYFRLVLIIFYLEELIMIGMCEMLGLEVIRLRKVIMVVFEFSMFLFMLMLIIWVLVFICCWVISRVFVQFFLWISWVNLVELVMLVCLLMLMNSELWLMVNGFRLDRWQVWGIFGMVCGGYLVIVLVIVSMCVGVVLQQLLMILRKLVVVNFLIIMVIFVGDLLYLLKVFGRLVLGWVEIWVLVLVDSFSMYGCNFLVLRVQFRFIEIGWVCCIEFQKVLVVWFDRVWLEVLVMVLEIMIGSFMLSFLNMFWMVNIVVLVLRVLKMVLIRIRLVLFLIRLWVVLMQFFISLLKVMLWQLGLFMFGEIEQVWLVGLSMLVMKCGLFGVLVVFVFVIW